jgi:hypothetical protein
VVCYLKSKPHFLFEKEGKKNENVKGIKPFSLAGSVCYSFYKKHKKRVATNARKGV